MDRSVLVTGGAGYIGSHACVALLEAGCSITVVDDLRNSSEEALRRVREITGMGFEFVRLDLVDAPAVRSLFESHHFDAVMHFAGLKAVGESTEIPLAYYRNNLTGTMNLLECMRERGPRKLVFSSSATVYGDPDRVPITEDAPLRATNPYGRTKLAIEDICRDIAAAGEGGDWHILLLRYFNPVGAHESGRIGEDPLGVPNNLMPFIMQVAVGRRDELRVFGGDYDTPDGTGVRDYIHVMDLVLGHVAAVEAIDEQPGCRAINLGTGHGHSVLEVVRAVETVVGRPIPHTVVDRRPGDVARLYADASLARDVLGWEAKLSLEDACRDAWNWQRNNPGGFAA